MPSLPLNAGTLVPVWQPETLDLQGNTLPPLAFMNDRESAPLAARLLLLWLPLSALAWVVFGWHVTWRGFGYMTGGGFPVEGVRALAVSAMICGMLAFAGGMTVRQLLRGSDESFPGPGLSGLEVFALGFLLAQGALGLLAGWVGFFVIGPVVGLTPLALVCVLIWRRERESIRAAYERFRTDGRRRDAQGVSHPALRAGRIAAMVFLGFVILAALAPAVESDGLRYHLVAPREWLRAGQFVNLPYNANSNLPAMSGLLVASLTGVMDLGRVFQLMQAFNLAALTVLAAGLARQIFHHLPGKASGPGVLDDRGLISSLTPPLVVGIPVVAILGAWPFVDVASAAFLVAALRVIGPGALDGHASRDWRWVLAGLLLSASAAVKLSILPLAIAVGAYAVLRQMRQPGGLQNLLAFSAAGLLVLGPWLVKSLHFHGNPVYPVAWGVFGGPEWSEFNQRTYEGLAALRGMGKDLPALLLLPVNLLAHWPRFEEHNPGPGWLGLLVPAAVGVVVLLRRRGLVPRAGEAGSFPLVVFAIFLWGLLTWFVTYQSVRFLIPHLVLLTALGVAMLVWLCSSSPRLMKDLAWWLLLVGIAGGLWAPVYRTIHTPVNQVALGLEAPEDFITRRFNAYPAVQWLNENTEPDEPVFYVGEHRAGHARTFRPLASDWFDTPLVLVELRAAGSAEALLQSWRDRGIRYVLYNQAELSMYEAQAFRPRFSTAEWREFEALRAALLQDVAFDSLGGVFVCRVAGGD